MKRPNRQILRGTLFLIGFGAASVWAWKHYSPSIFRFPFLSGWVLFGTMLILAAFNLRKKLSFLPIGQAESWLQAHIYIGWLTALLFGIHLGWRRPDGWFEIALAALYGLVFLSGVLGLLLSRLLPKRLTTRGGEVIFERIPAARKQLAAEAQALAMNSIAPSNGAATLADFYLRELKDFFEQPPPIVRHLVGDRRAIRTRLTELKDLNRFLAAGEREPLQKIAVLVEQKDTLDFHYVTQLTLKLWLFVHLPFTFALLLFTLVHILLVYSFAGGRL